MALTTISMLCDYIFTVACLSLEGQLPGHREFVLFSVVSSEPRTVPGT